MNCQRAFGLLAVHRGSISRLEGEEGTSFSESDERPVGSRDDLRSRPGSIVLPGLTGKHDNCYLR